MFCSDFRFTNISGPVPNLFWEALQEVYVDGHAELPVF